MIETYKRQVEIGALNREAAADPQGFVDRSEAEYRIQIAAVADRFAAAFPRQRVILLSGPSSAGKTTTSHNLDNELEKRGIETFALSLDDFFLDREAAPLLPDGTADLESPLMVDIPLLENCLKTLFETGACDFPIFDFKKGRRSENKFHYVYDDRTAIIIEGLHALNPLISGRPSFANALKLYISIKTEFDSEGTRILNSRDMRFIRRIIRDNTFRGCPPTGTMSMWENVVRGEDAHIRPFRQYADVWIDSLHLYEPMLYKEILQQLLQPCLEDPLYGKEAMRLLKLLDPFLPLPKASIPADSLMREFLEEF